MDLDYYRSLHSCQLLRLAREEGINPDMAVALAERLEDAYDDAGHLWGGTHGGRYMYNHRSENT